MRTGSPGVLAAGGCAELGSGLHPSTLEEEPRASGRIAGANSTGMNVMISGIRAWSCFVFGVRWSAYGLGPRSARKAGLDVSVVSERWGERSSCSLVYDRLNGYVVGAETVEDPACQAPPLAAICQRGTLRSLAYDVGWGSSDISMVSETARLGLRAWSGS
jgi:hypothetical protein